MDDINEYIRIFEYGKTSFERTFAGKSFKMSHYSGFHIPFCVWTFFSSSIAKIFFDIYKSLDFIIKNCGSVLIIR